MKRRFTFTVRHDPNWIGWVSIKRGKSFVTRVSRLMQVFGQGSVPKTDYKVVYSLDENGQYEVTSPITIRSISDSWAGGIICFFDKYPEWIGKRFNRKVIPIQPLKKGKGGAKTNN